MRFSAKLCCFKQEESGRRLLVFFISLFICPSHSFCSVFHLVFRTHYFAVRFLFPYPFNFAIGEQVSDMFFYFFFLYKFMSAYECVCVCVVVRYICNMHINVYVHSLVLYVMNEIRFVSKTQEKGYIAHSVQIRAKALFHSTASTEIVGLCPLVFFFAFISPLW